MLEYCDFSLRRKIGFDIVDFAVDVDIFVVDIDTIVVLDRDRSVAVVNIRLKGIKVASVLQLVLDDTDDTLLDFTGGSAGQ